MVKLVPWDLDYGDCSLGRGDAAGSDLEGSLEGADTAGVGLESLHYGEVMSTCLQGAGDVSCWDAITVMWNVKKFGGLYRKWDLKLKGR